jgi:hypothetical protein
VYVHDPLASLVAAFEIGWNQPPGGVDHSKSSETALFGLYPVPVSVAVRPLVVTFNDAFVAAGGFGGAGGTNCPSRTAVTSIAPDTLIVQGLPCPAHAPSHALNVCPGVMVAVSLTSRPDSNDLTHANGQSIRYGSLRT